MSKGIKVPFLGMEGHGGLVKVPWPFAKEKQCLKPSPSERMTYLSEMRESRAQFYKELREALEVYFNAPTSTLGQSDADTLMVIIEDHVEHYFPKAGMNADNTTVSDPGITLVDGEGINLAYDWGAAMDNELLKALTHDKRIELLEACIYALNARLNTLEQRGEDDSGG